MAAMTSVGVCFGSPSPEHDISVLTGLQAARALAEGPVEVIGLYWSKRDEWWQVDAGLEAADFADGVPAKANRLELTAAAGGGFSTHGRLGKRNAVPIDVVVNCCHGGPGEDGTLQATFDLAGLRYTGPSQAGATLGMDKLAFAATMADAGLPVLPTVDVHDGLDHLPFSAPYIVKPRFGGSSIGIEVADDLDTVKALVRSQPLLAEGAIVQSYLADFTDLNISVRTCPVLELSAVERPLRKADGSIYSYADKYLTGTEGMASAPRELPAQLPTELEARLRSLAGDVARLALVRSVARIDFLLSGNDLWVNEINTIPGSLSWYFWAEEGVPFGRLLGHMLDEALAGPARTYRTDGADGTALRSVGTIASKLA